MDGIITCKPKKSSIGQYCKSYELSDVKLTYIQFTEILNITQNKIKLKKKTCTVHAFMNNSSNKKMRKLKTLLLI
ncbi:hypothetical protein PFFCH_05120 [Plasmodium falciparum FCH/4]|uniref:Uncharacterized protein n=1 Tax=Plasmodium falciparum FCH/4 TaxID=1036724 RepID=A0A024VGW8_PLAFA|nr:hypothetical protein PFFCH_05120 [Plasmodium falciparum FCH/4]